MEWIICEAKPRWAPALRVACIRNSDSTRRLREVRGLAEIEQQLLLQPCLLYTSDAADDLTRVDLGGRRIIKK